MNAAGLLMIMPGRGGARIFLIERSKDSSAPGVWAIPGGALESGESPLEAMSRECMEELGGLPPCRLTEEDIYKSGDLKYITLVGEVTEKAAREWLPSLNDEHVAWGWFYMDMLPRPLHFNVQRILRKMRLS
jgi:8-oxo-dGTP pyrophosphatase MutT (NUDIX family)